MSEKRTELQENETRIIGLEKDMISGEFGTALTDLMFLADSIDLENLESVTKWQTAYQWISFTNIKKVYDQILLIDEDGDIQIKINHSVDGAYYSSENELNTEHRSIYDAAANMEKGQAYISKIDLSMDRKVNTAQTTVHFATPLFNHTDGKFRGVVMISYNPDELLASFKTLASTSGADVYLLDSDGFWIANNDARKEWGSKFPARKQARFNEEYPREWAFIQNNDTGTLNTENGYFAFTHVIQLDRDLGELNNVDVALENGDWTAVSFIAKENANSIYFENNPVLIILNILKNRGWYFLIILMGSVIMGWLFVRNKYAKKEVKYYSEYDGMTNVLNRRGGFERIHTMYDRMKKIDGKMCICYADINGLKEVNDSLGHMEGDELIKAVVSGMEKGIRQSDFIVRLGGDEFLLVLLNADTEEAEQVWRRIENEYGRMNAKENRRYLVSVSHGMKECRFEMGDQIDDVIRSADEKMYEEKRNMKQNLKIVRS